MLEREIEKILYEVLKQAEARTTPFPLVKMGTLAHRETWIVDEAKRRIVDVVNEVVREAAERADK